MARRNRVLLVDDEPGVRLGLRRFLEAQGYDVEEAGDCRSAEQIAATSPPDLAVLDQRLPDGDGIDLLPKLKGSCPDLSVVMLTGHGSIELAVRAIKEGADQFLTKPVDLQAITVILGRLVEGRRNRQKQLARRPTPGRDAPDPFLGASPALKRLSEEAHRVVQADRPVLIQGETGTGKGVLARWIHDHGPRAEEPFVDVSCAALPRDLLESELFGHEAGAFTGANKAKAGLLEVAHRGTAFLDEIGDMDPASQPKLLKVLEDRRLRRLGDVRDRHVDVRLIAATHRDLRELIRAGRFREDLFFRISTLPLEVPPLRKRPEDIPLLARHILGRFAAELRRDEIVLSDEALRQLQSYAFPGNIRELRNVLERAVLVSDSSVLEPRDFLYGIASAPGTAVSETTATLAEVEKDHIRRVLQLEDGHVARAAQRLAISTSSLYERIKKHGLVSSRK